MPTVSTAKFKILLAIPLASALLSACAQTGQKSSYGADRPVVENFSLLDETGKFHELYRHTHKKAVVIIGHTDGCPILEKSYPTIARLRQRFSDQGVDFLFLNASPQDEPETLVKESERYGVHIPILKDDAQIIARSIGITRSAEAAVIVPGQWRLVYRGPIDDQYDYLGTKPSDGSPFLADALESILKNKKIQISEREAKGCLIGGRDQKVAFKDVAPIFQNKCMNCHAEGRYRPTNMSTYNQIVGWAPMIRETIRTKRMPPWPLDPHVGKFGDDLSLNNDETFKIVRWIELGTPFDAKSDPEKIPPPTLKSENRRKADLVISVSNPDQLPASGRVSYKTFFLGRSEKEEYWTDLFAEDLLSPQLVHHFALFIARDEMSDDSWGMKFPPAPGVERFFLKPGVHKTLPQNTALKVPKGAYLYLRGHYEYSGRPEQIRPQISFWRAPKGRKKPHSIQSLIIGLANMTIPAGTTRKVEASRTLNEDLWVIELSIHMHGRGKSGRITALLPDGHRQVLLSIPNYSPIHQHFTLEKPIHLPTGTKIVAEGEFDNTKDNPLNPNPNVDVFFGPSIQDEMFHATIGYY